MRLFGRRGAQRIGASLAFAARCDFCGWMDRDENLQTCSVGIPTGESPNIQYPENNSGYSTGKKTPGGAGTHTGHTRDTRAHTGTRITPRRTSQITDPMNITCFIQTQRHTRTTTRRPRLNSRMNSRRPGADRSPRPTQKRPPPAITRPCRPSCPRPPAPRAPVPARLL